MMVDSGEGKVFERKLPQASERRAGGQATRGHLVEQARELLGSHATWATGSRYSRKIISASPIDSI